jgi:ribose-phosphate pyrophosphokinase
MAKQGLYNPVIVSPDAGGVERAKIFIEGLSKQGLPARLAVIVKQRADAGVIEKMNLIGDVEGCDAVIIDDICDTAGTLVEAAKLLKEQGARRVFACVTHPLLSGPACQRIAASEIEKFIVTDTIPLRCCTPANLLQVSIAPLLTTAIKLMISGDSLTDLFH